MPSTVSVLSENDGEPLELEPPPREPRVGQDKGAARSGHTVHRGGLRHLRGRQRPRSNLRLKRVAGDAARPTPGRPTAETAEALRPDRAAAERLRHGHVGADAIKG